MQATRALGNTGIEISTIGLGCWGLGGAYYGEIPRQVAVDAMRTYIEEGGRHLDTAYSYQASEEILGEAIKPYDRKDLIITSKTYGGSHNPETLGKIRHDCEISLKGIGVDYIDVYMTHGSPPDPDQMNAVLDELDTLKEEGKIRIIGASIPGPVVTDDRVDRALQYIRSGRVKVLQLNYSIARQKLGQIFDEAREHGVGIITRWVLESGMLTGKYEVGHEFVWPDTRNRYLPKERDAYLALAQELKTMLPEGYTSPAQVAVAFALHHPGVSGTVLGATNPDQVKRNCAMVELPPLPDELVEKLRATYGPFNDSFNPTGEFEHVDGRLNAKLR